MEERLFECGIDGGRGGAGILGLVSRRVSQGSGADLIREGESAEVGSSRSANGEDHEKVRETMNAGMTMPQVRAVMTRTFRRRPSFRSVANDNCEVNPPVEKLSRQQGFSLVEVSIVTALMILIAIIGLPAIQGYLIENKVPRVAEDLQRFIARMKVSGIGAGPSPYLGVSQRTLANGMRDAAAIRVYPKDQAVVHGLGGTGQAGNGTVTLLPAALAGGVEGSAFKLVLTNVNHAACPALAAVMQRMATQVRVGGKGPGQEVKNSAAVPAREYDPILADAQCMVGDVNTFEFVVQ